MYSGLPRAISTIMEQNNTLIFFKKSLGDATFLYTDKHLLKTQSEPILG